MLELRRSDEKAIADRLRREAFEHRPPFSQALHERICQAIRECAVGEERAAQRPPPARPALLSVVSCPLSVVRRAQRSSLARPAALWAASVAVAACIVAAVVLIGQVRRPGGSATTRIGPESAASVGIPALADDGTRSEKEQPPEGGTPTDGRMSQPLVAAKELKADAPQVNLHTVASLSERLSSSLPAMVDGSLADQRWAYLDHDARLTMEMLARRFPFDLTSSPTRGSAANTP